MSDRALAPLVAIIGADGSGKSTLASDLAADFAKERPTEYVYLGLGSAPMGEKVASLPLIGTPLARVVEKRARRTRDPKDRIPGALTALVVYRLSRMRKARFDAMMELRRRGVMVITDRYPQVEAAGLYDGPGLSTARAEGRFVRRLAAREARLYAEMAANVPTLVLRLNIDAETALARKPDHRRELVEAKIALTPGLRFGGARIAEIDATMPYDKVRARARRAIEAELAQA